MLNVKNVSLLIMICLGAWIVQIALSEDGESHVLLDKKFEGYLRGRQTYTANIDEFRNSEFGYAQLLEVSLKAGSTIVVDAEVLGKDRTIGFLLEDPDGARVTFVRPKIGQLNVKVAELNANGKYRLTVISSLSGPFSVKVTSDASERSEEDETLKLRSEIQMLETLLANAKTRLSKHMQSKK